MLKFYQSYSQNKQAKYQAKQHGFLTTNNYDKNLFFFVLSKAVYQIKK